MRLAFGQRGPADLASTSHRLATMSPSMMSFADRLLDAAKAALLRRAGRAEASREYYAKAIGPSANQSQSRYLMQRLAEVLHEV